MENNQRWLFGVRHTNRVIHPSNMAGQESEKLEPHNPFSSGGHVDGGS